MKTHVIFPSSTSCCDGLTQRQVYAMDTYALGTYLASEVTHMYSLKAVDYAKVEHEFKMFELVLNSICPDVCGSDMPVVILLS